MPISTDFLKQQGEAVHLIQEAFDQSPLNMVVIDFEEMQVATANQTALQALGYTKAELMSKAPKDIIVTFSNEWLQTFFDNIINEKEQPTSFPLVYRRKDKRIFDVEAFVRTIVYNHKNCVLVISGNTDVNKEEQDRSQFHATLFNSIPDAVMATDEHWCITSYNRHAQEMFGWDAAEAIGKSTQALMAPIYINISAAEAHKALFENGTWKGEIIVHKKSGEAFPVIISLGVANNESGKITGIVAVISDITARKKLEQELKSLNERLEQRFAQKTKELTQVFDRISDGFIAYDVDWNFTYINQKAVASFNLEQEYLIGKNIWKEFPQTVGTSIYNKYHQAMQEQISFRTEEYIDLYQKWFEVVLYPSPEGLSVYFRDITDKKKAEGALAESELLYRTIVETAQEGIWQIDEHNNTTFVNSYMANLLGYTKDELTGASLFRFMTDEAKEEVFQLVEARKRGISQQHEFAFLKKDCTLVNTLLQSTPIIKDGKYKGALAMVLDISERKRAEAQLIANEKRFRALFEHSEDGIALLNSEGAILDVSPSVEKLIGLGKEDLVNTSRLNFIAPEYIPLVYNNFRAVIDKPDQPQTATYECVLPDGSRKWLECTCSNLLHEPAVQAIILNFRDITERKSAEEKNKLKADLLNTIGQAVIATDLQGIVTYWNKAAEHIYGWTEIEAVGSNIVELTPTYQGKAQALKIMETLKQGNTWTGEFEVQRKDGSIFSAQVTDAPIYDKEGNLTGIIGVSTDITRQKKIEQALLLSERNYRLLFDESPVPLWMTDADNYDFININQAAIAQYGYTKEEFIRMNANDIRVPDEHFFLKMLDERRKEMKPFEEIAKHRRKNGEIIDVKINATLIQYDGKEVWLAAGKDITQELQNERNLKQNQQQLSLIFNSTENAMWLLKVEANNQFRLLAVNSALARFNNMRKEDMVGYLLNELFDVVKYQHLLLRYLECAESGQIQKFTNIEKINGEERVFDFTVIPIKDEQENVTQLLGICADITEQKKAERRLVESEEKYKALFEKSPLPKWIFDSETLRFLEVNHAATKQYGYSREEFLSMNLFDIRPQESALELASMYKKDLPETINFDTLHQKKNGELIKVHITANSFCYENKEARMAIVVDLTEQEKAKDELLASTRQLRELASHLQDVREEERTYIAREIHDELGQQLTALKMDISWLNRKWNSENENIQSRIKSALELIDSTINAVRKIAAQLRPSILDDLGLAEAISWQSREFSCRTGIEVKCNIKVVYDKFLPAVSVAIFRIYQEALTNIARHAGATKVTCSLLQTDNSLCLSVVDNGRGFDIDKQTERKTLGLLGMQERVVMLNGKYSIKSKPGEGTKLDVEIPMEGQ